MKDLLAELHRFNVWANTRVADAFSQIVEVPARSLHLFSHLLNAQTIWEARIKDTKAPYAVFQDHDLQTVMSLAETSSNALLNLVEGLSDEGMNRYVSYTNTQGHHYSNAVYHMLTHVVTHATYHRAQIATDLRANGFPPPNTDFITFTRELEAAKTASL